MESFEGSTLDNVGSTVRKKRSNMPRRPRLEENTGYEIGSWKKEFDVNQRVLNVSPGSRVDDEADYKNSKDGIAARGEYHGKTRLAGNGPDFGRSSEGVLAPTNWRSSGKVKDTFEMDLGKQDSHMGSGKNREIRSSGQSRVISDGSGNENKLRKVRLKVGGVTHTIHAKATTSGGASVGGLSSRSTDAPKHRQKLILQDSSDEDNSPSNKTSGSHEISLKDFSAGGSRAQMPVDDISRKQKDNYESVRKSKRAPKRRLLDGEFDDESEDEEIRYLERLKFSKTAPDYSKEWEDDSEEGSRKHRKISKVLKSKIGQDTNKNSKSESTSEDTYYIEEKETVSDGEVGGKRKNQKKESVDLLMDGKKEVSLTSRQKALKSGISTGSSTSLIEFPNGLPPAPPRKQKEKLSEVEQQLKKAEAVQRRRVLAEKAARESEAEAIRKILGQDSTRKKREDKIKKRRDELAQERANYNSALSSTTVRWVSSPTGTIVTFPKEMGLPNIFDPKPCSYPPPRAKCAGPSCNNTYKYRDSKSNLPLCSLQCYKAIHEQMQPLSTC